MDSLHFHFIHKVDSGDRSALYSNLNYKEISFKKFKNHLQFYVKILLKKKFSFFTGKSFYNFSKKLLLRIFFKISLQEGDFENSLKFLQLVPNLTPIRKLLCTFLYQCCYYLRPPPLTYPNIKEFKGPKMDSLHFHFHFHFTFSLSITMG